MKDLFEILKKIGAENNAAYLEAMAYCDTRVTADEGIPAIIALDDLTNPGCDAAYESAPADREMGMVLAAKALLYTSLYEEREKKDDDKYPSICPAMSATAEDCFRAEYAPDGDFTVIPYRDVVGAFVEGKKAATEDGK